MACLRGSVPCLTTIVVLHDGRTSYIYMFQPIRQIFPLASRATDWQSGRSFGIQVNLLANGKIWCMGQPTGKVVNRCTKFTMLFPSTKLLVYTPSEPLNLFFLPPLHMPSPCHSCCILSLNCCIGSLSCTQSSCTQSDS